MNLHLVTFLPCMVDDEVPLLQVALHFLTVHLDGVAKTFAISIGVEIAGHNLTLHPSRDADGA